MSLIDQVRWLPGARRLCDEVRAELPQKDQLCGAFTALTALRAAGEVVSDQESVASVAGTVLLADVTGAPEGEQGRHEFRGMLPVTVDSALAGTSASGVQYAVEKLSEGRVSVVPASGDWDDDNLHRLLAGAYQCDPVTVIANVATRDFVAQDSPDRSLADYLDGGFPPLWTSRWKVGHFVHIGGLLDGAEDSLVAIVDTYASLGRQGIHLQPMRNVAAALRREGMSSGGILLLVPAEQERSARELISNSGLCCRVWDNGSPAPGGAFNTKRGAE